MEQIFIYWNGAHWVARLHDRTICGRADEVKVMVYAEDCTPIFIIEDIKKSIEAGAESYDELAELQSLRPYINTKDVNLLAWAQ